MALQTNWEIILTLRVCQVWLPKWQWFWELCATTIIRVFFEPWKVLACCMRSCALNSKSQIETLITYMTSAKIILLGITLQRRQNIDNSAQFDLFWENGREYIKSMKITCWEIAHEVHIMNFENQETLEVFNIVSKQNCWRNRFPSLS